MKPEEGDVARRAGRSYPVVDHDRPRWHGRLFANPVAWGAVGVLTLLQLGFVYLPFVNTTFETAPLGILGWVVPGLIGLGVFAAVELEKAVMRSRDRH